MSEPGTLEEQAIKRREKLIALKRKRDELRRSKDPTANHEQAHLPLPLFRSYKPADSSLHDNLLPAAEPGNVPEQVASQLEAAKSNVLIDELDITNLAPRKPDWDLKRDVAKKLEKLERRTQMAIAELIRERLKERLELSEDSNVDIR